MRDWVCISLCPTLSKLIDTTDFQHNLCLLTFENELGLSPPNHYNSNVKRVLDLGTGTGIWAIDFGDEHPEATVRREAASEIWSSWLIKL